MQIEINQCSIELLRADITEQEVDAIVNAANASPAGGGGVDGAIHRCGGPAIMRETNEKYPEGCPTGTGIDEASRPVQRSHDVDAWRALQRTRRNERAHVEIDKEFLQVLASISVQLFRARIRSRGIDTGGGFEVPGGLYRGTLGGNR